MKSVQERLHVQTTSASHITKSPTTTEAKDGKIPKNPFVMDEIVISVPKSKNVNPNNDNNETDNK